MRTYKGNIDNGGGGVISDEDEDSVGLVYWWAMK
jgi:hypothetical protein